MGWKDFFRKKDDKLEMDPLKDLILSNLDVGYLVDYDLKTWKVEACHYSDWGAGDITREWQLKSYDETIYLEKESDDEDSWCVTWKIPIGRLGSHITDHIISHDDPPDRITFEGKVYHLEESGGGHFYPNSRGPRQEFLKWDYEDESGESYLSIIQWGEKDFEATLGKPVEEYQFANILPAENGGG